MKLNSDQLRRAGGLKHPDVDPRRIDPHCKQCGERFETVTQKVRHKCES